MHFKIRFLLQYSFHFVAARKKTDRKSPETRFEEVFLAELIWRLVPGVSPNYTTSEMPAKFRFQWHYSFGLSEKTGCQGASIDLFFRRDRICQKEVKNQISSE